jgi:hypothetical protein
MKNLECIDLVVHPPTWQHKSSSDLVDKAVELAKQVLRRVSSESGGGTGKYVTLQSLDGAVRRYLV